MKKINCPQCRSVTYWTEGNKFKPFCSRRCQLIDLGAWATERHKISGEIFITTDETIDETAEH